MNKRSCFIFPLFFITSISLLSCLNIKKSSNKNLTYEDFAFATKYKSFLPSKGEINVLVIPIEFSDRSSFSEEEINNLNLAFNGDIENEFKNSYWESVKSFYGTSSYENLKLNFIFSDNFIPSISSETFLYEEKNSSNGAISILNEFYTDGTINNNPINYKDFDKNSDGYVDGVWMIYNTDDYLEVFKDENFWAYTSWTTKDADLNSPVFNTFSNCSNLFLSQSKNSNGLDSHILIHETGHMLGLDDYYSYETSAISASGGLMMMDLNVGDHDPFSKYALGWINPEIVKQKRIYKLKPFVDSGDCLIIPSSSFYESAFGEYLIIEYYTPNSLNYLDSNVKYNGVKLYDEEGILIYHIDSRLINVKIDNITEGSGTYNYIKLDNYNFNESSLTDFVEISASNTSFYSSNGNDLISLIPKDNELIKDHRISSNSSLFQIGDNFSINEYSKFFKNSSFNDKSQIDFNVKISSISEEYAEIEVY